MISWHALAGMIDHTLLRADVKKGELQKLCAEAMTYGFKTVAVNNASIAYCKDCLEGSPVGIDAAVSFPLGQATLQSKLFETRDAIKNGASEVDYVINITAVKQAEWAYVEKEMESIVGVCHAEGVICKVIFENCYLVDEEKKQLCLIALQTRPDFIKTSTGFGSGGATPQDVSLMKGCVGTLIGIKASGGIRSLDDALGMIEAGASRIGTSRGADIVEACQRRRAETGRL